MADETDKTATEAEIRAKVLAELQAELKAATGVDSIAALKAAREKAEADKLAADGRYQELAATAEAKAKAAEERIATITARAEILSASSAAIDPETVHALLASQASVDEKGAVSIGGKPVADAVAALLVAKPFLAKPAAGQGSGSGATSGGGAKTLSRTAFERLPPAARMAHIHAGGTVSEVN